MQNSDDLISLIVDGPPQAQTLSEHLRQQGHWLEVVAGIETVVVRFDAATMDAATARHLVEEAMVGGAPSRVSRETLCEIPIVYGGEYGPDLDALCSKLGITEEEFIARHTGTEHRVDLIGFTPGFAFIGGLDESLHVPRRKEPRQRVAAGSVGIADGRTGLYALPSPGGWTLIGRTPYALFDPESDEPFALRAGMRIRFVAATPEVFQT